VACFEALVARDACHEGEDAVVRRGHLIAVVVAFLVGCAVVVVVGASGVRAQTSQEKEKQGHTEATDTEQGHSGGAAPQGADRCDKTRTIVRGGAGYLTNDLPGCPKGGLLSAKLPDTGKGKITSPTYGLMRGEKGDDEIRGGSELYGGEGNDHIYGGPRGAWSIVGDDGDDIIFGGEGDDAFLDGGKGEDILHGGPGGDSLLFGGDGDDVIYGGDGDDTLSGGEGKDLLYAGDGNDKLQQEVRMEDGQPDKLYCGKGKDQYDADKFDYVDSSCEKKKPTKSAKERPGGRREWGSDVVFDEHTSSASSSASASPFVVPPGSGGPDILLPAAALLFGSGLLTYTILRRR
jgi:Ca2+-binding RTX toxin-like protein